MDCHLRSGQLLVVSVQYAKIFFQNMLRLEEVYDETRKKSLPFAVELKDHDNNNAICTIVH